VPGRLLIGRVRRPGVGTEHGTSPFIWLAAVPLFSPPLDLHVAEVLGLAGTQPLTEVKAALVVAKGEAVTRQQGVDAKPAALVRLDLARHVDVPGGEVGAPGVRREADQESQRGVAARPAVLIDEPPRDRCAGPQRHRERLALLL